MKILALSEFQNPVKSDIENIKQVFQIEDDGGIGGKCACVQLIAPNKELLSQTTAIFCLNLGKDNWNILLPDLSFTQFLINLLNTRDRKGPIQQRNKRKSSPFGIKRTTGHMNQEIGDFIMGFGKQTGIGQHRFEYAGKGLNMLDQAATGRSRLKQVGIDWNRHNRQVYAGKGRNMLQQAYSCLYQLIPINYSLIQSTPVYFSLFQSIPIYSSLIQSIKVFFQISNLQSLIPNLQFEMPNCTFIPNWTFCLLVGWRERSLTSQARVLSCCVVFGVI